MNIPLGCTFCKRIGSWSTSCTAEHFQKVIWKFFFSCWTSIFPFVSFSLTVNMDVVDFLYFNWSDITSLSLIPFVRTRDDSLFIFNIFRPMSWLLLFGLAIALVVTPRILPLYVCLDLYTTCIAISTLQWLISAHISLNSWFSFAQWIRKGHVEV